MGHRALVAYERPNRKYNLHYTHWGGIDLRLKQMVTSSNPFGCEECDADSAYKLLEELLTATSDDEVDDQVICEEIAMGMIDPNPVAIDLTLEAILTDYLDCLHYEMLYVVDQEFEIVAYQILWFGLQYDCKSITDAPKKGNGALIRVEEQQPPTVDYGNLLTKWATSKDILGDCIDRGFIPVEEGTEYLREKIEEWTPPGTEIRFSEQYTIGSS